MPRPAHLERRYWRTRRKSDSRLRFKTNRKVFKFKTKTLFPVVENRSSSNVIRIWLKHGRVSEYGTL